MPSFSLNVPLLAQRDRADCLPICVEMMLAYLRTDHLSYWHVETAHALVVTDIDDESVVVNDPAFLVQQRIARAEFLLA